MTEPFIRPVVKAWLWRWREPLAASALCALGVWWFATSGGVLAWAGGALALGGGAVAFAAFRRARFLSPGGGMGVVHVDEGRLTYMGPLTGGSVVIREILSVGIDPRHRPTHWVVHDGETELFIPVDAEEAGALFDVFAQLPGLDLGAVLDASERVHDAPTTLWRRGDAVPANRRLRQAGPRWPGQT